MHFQKLTVQCTSSDGVSNAAGASGKGLHQHFPWEQISIILLIIKIQDSRLFLAKIPLHQDYLRLKTLVLIHIFMRMYTNNGPIDIINYLYPQARL